MEAMASAASCCACRMRVACLGMTVHQGAKCHLRVFSLNPSSLHLFGLPACCSMAASPSAHLLAPLLEQGGQLACLCDAKAAGGQSYYRLNDDKVSRSEQAIACRARARLSGCRWQSCVVLQPRDALLQMCCCASLHRCWPGCGSRWNRPGQPCRPPLQQHSGVFAGHPDRIRSLLEALAPHSNPCAMRASMNPPVHAWTISKPHVSRTAHRLLAYFLTATHSGMDEPGLTAYAAGLSLAPTRFPFRLPSILQRHG